MYSEKQKITIDLQSIEYYSDVNLQVIIHLKFTYTKLYIEKYL